jgi:transcriptional regulator with XRE-family HTH domain
MTPSETPVQRAIRARLQRAPAVSKRALARQIGVKPDRLIAWERGTPPRDYQLVKMAPHLDVSVDELRDSGSKEASEALPSNVAEVLRELAAVADVIPAMKEIDEKAPDLIAALKSVRKLARRLEL